MPVLRLASAIENARTPSEEAVLALLDHLMPTLAQWRQAEHLRAEQSSLTGQLSPLLQQIEEGTRRVEGLRSDSESLARQQQKFKKSSMLAGGLAVLLSVALWLGGIGLTVAAIVLVAGLGVAFWQRRKVQQTGARLALVRQELNTAEADLAAQQMRLRDTESRLSVIATELEARRDGFPEVLMARVGLPLSIQTIAGTSVLVDQSDSHPDVRLQAVDFSEISQQMKDIGEAVQGISNLPPLLAPGDKPIEDPMTELYGEESQLQDLVGDFTVTLGKIREVTLSLPMVPARSALLDRVRRGQLEPASSQIDLQIDAPQGQEMFDRFMVAVDSADPSGANVPGLIDGVYKSLEETCANFAHARMSSMNTIHEGLTQVLSRANWVGQKFLCPRTVQSPKYVQDMLGVQIKEAHLVPLHDLLDRLQSDEVIRLRAAKKPDLLDQLENAYHEVQDLAPSMIAGDGSPTSDHSRPRYMDQQYEESLKQFRLVLTQVITGASRPVLNVTPQAQLFYDPQTEEWSSDATPYVYPTPQVIQYGMTTKVMHDLMLPLWEHLWTEKADFRKSELFRTNEAMITMTEKESEKLIEIGNQFRADMRGNRENIYLIEAELKSKHQEIVDFRDGLQRLNLMSERVMLQLRDDKLKELVLDESPLEVGGRYETNLALMPRMQAQVRGTVPDPIDMLREPSLLIESMKPSAPRLLAD